MFSQRGRPAGASARVERALQIMRNEGLRGTAQRGARVMYRRLDAGALEFPLLPGDVADSRQLQLADADPLPAGQPLRIGWVSTPPSLGSGGHTTMFRMVSALEAAGHSCTMFLYDRHGGEVRSHEAIVRQGWPSVQARVIDAAEGLEGVDVCVATSWPSAHVLARRGRGPMKRMYFVQDYEPFFYPLGAEYALAEDSYRFGFRCVTIGHMLANLLAERCGVRADVVEFGCDDDVYRLENTRGREGVVFYARPDAPRRGFQLGVLSLQELHRRRPEVPIHTIGHANLHLPFPAIHHGVTSPSELAKLYNRVVAGLALSFSNITLLVEEFLVCGAVPVINDTFDFRLDAPSSQVRWASATPSGIADALVELVDAPPDAAQVAASAGRAGWQASQSAFVEAVEAEAYGR